MQTRDRLTGSNLLLKKLEKRFVEYTEDLAEGCISKIKYKNLIDDLIEATLLESTGITFMQKKELEEASKGIMLAATIIGKE